MISLGEIRSGAQALATARAARGENLPTTSGRKAGAKAVTALAHQFAGLISPLHGSFSADRAIRLILRLSPVMLAQTGPFPAQMSRPG
jgi:hypothetical protein